MNKQRKKRLTNPILLHQKVIHLQSELTKYENIVKNYENKYHVTQFEQLIKENESLKKRLHDTEINLQNKIRDLEKQILIMQEKENKNTSSPAVEEIEQMKSKSEKLEEKLSETTDNPLPANSAEINEANSHLNEKLANKMEYTHASEDEQSIDSTPIVKKQTTNTLLSDDELQVLQELEPLFQELFIQSFRKQYDLDPRTIFIEELEKKIDELTKEIKKLESSSND